MEFRDLKKQYQILRDDIETKINSVCTSARYISGPEVKELEIQLAEYVGVKHCISCANGTDAITLALKVWGIGQGDAVFVPDFTFFSSGECPAAEGATCIFVDVDDRSYNLDSEKLELAIEKVLEEGKLTPKVVIAVDLFGLPADYDNIKKICNKYNLLLLEDGAQGFGGEIKGKRACSFGDISTTSFFPAKPLGCYGDGGAIFTDNDEWATLLRSYAVHGKDGDDKYNNIRLGMNSRLDTIQAAILQVKLKAFIDYEVKDINKVAECYTAEFENCGLDKIFVLPKIEDGFLSSWAQYTIQLPNEINRENLQKELKKFDIPTMVYYIKPMHQQGAYANTISANADCPVTERLSATVLSLPMHPYMQHKDVTYVVSKINEIVKQIL